jgi:hypothetical protein
VVFDVVVIGSGVGWLIDFKELDILTRPSG